MVESSVYWNCSPTLSHFIFLMLLYGFPLTPGISVTFNSSVFSLSPSPSLPPVIG